MELECLGQWPSIICILIGACGLLYRFWKWFKNKKESPIIAESTPIEQPIIYIPFIDAIKIIGDCGYYEANGHTKMWENSLFTREKYYRHLLERSITSNEISLYGRKIYSSNKEFQKIEVGEFKKLHLEEDCNFLSSTLSDWSRQNVYTDISFEKDELNLFIEKLKSK